MSIRTFLTEAGKDSPIVGLGAAHFAGLQLSDWAFLMGLLYGVIRVGFLLVEGYWKLKDRQNGKGS